MSKFDLLKNRAAIAALILVGGAALPAQSQKFAILKLDTSCNVAQSQYHSLRVSSSKFYSPPDGLPGERTGKLSVFYSNKPVEKVPKDIWSSYLFAREKSLWSSPGFSWIEQKLSSLSGFGPTDQEGLFSRLMNMGQRSIDRDVITRLDEGGMYGFSGWVDRSPLFFIQLGADKDIESMCSGEIWDSLEIFQRGFFLPWGKQLGFSLKRSQVDILFNPKLQTLVARFFPLEGLSQAYFEAESSRSFYVGFSFPDLPFFVRAFLLLFAAVLSLISLTRLSGSSSRSVPGGKIVLISRLVLVNLISVIVLIVAALGLVEILLMKTTILDEPFSRNPSFIPLANSLVANHSLALRMEASNAYGFTDEPVSSYDKPAKCKIAVLGDSFVWGSGFGVSNIANRWTSQLQKLVPSCRVFHWGVPGWGPVEQASFMNKSGRHHDVDLLILGVVTNDFDVPGGFELNRRRIRGLVESFGKTPSLVALTPWSGLSSHHQASFSMAKKLFSEEGLAVKDCLADVQSVVGDAVLPRRMWSTSLDQMEVQTFGLKSIRAASVRDPNRTVAVDRHPGMPVTKVIASCVKNHLEEQVKVQARLGYLREYLQAE